MDDREQKREFAKQLLRNDGDAFKAAFAVCGEDTAFALQIARRWLLDPFVVAEQEKMLAGSNAKSFLPTKEQQAKDIYSLATNEKQDIESRLKAHRLYAEIMGHIEKPTVGGGVIVNQGVMVVRDAGTDQDWETKALRQQHALISDARPN